MEAIDRQKRTTPLEAKSARHDGFIYRVLSHQPFPNTQSASLLLRLNRSPQLVGSDPAVLQHKQANRNPVLMGLLGGCPSTQFPANCRAYR